METEAIWIDGNEAAEMIGCTHHGVYIYSRNGLVVGDMRNNRRVYWLDSVQLLVGIVKRSGGIEKFKARMRREGQRLRYEKDVPFWWDEVQAFLANGVPSVPQPAPDLADVAEIAPDLFYTRRTAAKLLGCSPSTVKRLQEDGDLGAVKRGRNFYVDGETLGALARLVADAGGYEAFGAARRAGAMRSVMVTSEARHTAVCGGNSRKGCKVLLDCAPEGDGVFCGWCVEERAAVVR